jgi:hypothetical protein
MNVRPLRDFAWLATAGHGMMPPAGDNFADNGDGVCRIGIGGTFSTS